MRDRLRSAPGGEGRPSPAPDATRPAAAPAPGPVGLVRDRLLTALEAPPCRLVLLHGAPGSGKSTLLTQHLARRAERGLPTASYRARPADRTESSLAAALHRALDEAGLPDPGEDAGRRPTVDDLLERLRAAPPGLRVVVDDAHLLAGSPAEVALGRLVELAPAGLTGVVCGRHEPGPALARLALAVDTVTLTGEDLRFRSWEVADLFDRLYGEPLPPEDTAALARHTEGWAAGLQMFHLATVGRPLAERRAAVAGLWGRGRLLRSYLAGTVLDGLDESVRDFLVRSCALLVLDGPTCDELLQRTGSEQLLAELAERQVLTLRLDETSGLYRYHAALQVQLESLLHDRLGPEAARAWYRRAGALSTSAGRPYEALRAFLRAGAWDEAREVLNEHGSRIAAFEVPEEAVVAGLADDDPWLALAAARSMLAAGDLAGAVAAYRSAAEVSGGEVVEDVCRRERHHAEVWLPSGPTWPTGTPLWPTAAPPWPQVLREAVRGYPGRFTATQDVPTEPGALLATALAALLDGAPAEAVRRARAVDGEPGSAVSLAALLLVETVESGLAPARGAAGIERLAAEAEQHGQPWMARTARALTAVVGGDAVAEAEAVRAMCLREGDPWGALLAGMALGIGGLADGLSPTDVLEDTVDRAHRLDAGSVEAWARGLHALALARAGLPHAELEAERAETCARQAGVPAVRALAFAALARLDGSFEDLAVATVAEHDLPLPLPRPRIPPPAASGRGRAQPGLRLEPPRDPAASTPAPPAVLRCLGGFELTLAGQAIDWSLVRPRARTVLRMLAVHVGSPVNEEHLLESLWPRLPPSSARHNLHVAVSALRRALEPDAPRGAARLVHRQDTAYVLSLPYGSSADVTAFRTAVTRWTAVRGGSPEVLRPALREVLRCYTGDLLPEEGPAEWVVGEREALRSDAVRAAAALAELELVLGDAPAAAEAGERAVRLDPFRDVGWRLLVAAYEESGDAAAAARARHGYAQVLRELGLDDSSVPPPQRRPRVSGS